jgi:hypothetical protein
LNLIITMNSGGDYIPPNALRSHMYAASRWGAHYFQYMTRDDVLSVKMAALAGNYGGDRVMWLDGDTLIRDDCPSPFDATPEQLIGAVRNDQGDTHGPDCAGIHESSWDYSRDALGLTPEQAPFDITAYVNTGVVVSTPQYHHSLFAAAFSALEKMQPASRWEKDQSLVSVLCKATGQLHPLPYVFNRLGPKVVEKGHASMDAYIQHYAPIGGFRPDKFKYLSLTNWQTATMPPIDWRCTHTITDPQPEPVTAEV